MLDTTQLEIDTRTNTIRELGAPPDYSNMQMLGSGASKTAYAFSSDLVYKRDNGSGWRDQCSAEIDIWSQVQNTRAARFFAPILGVFDDGSYLQVRAAYVVSNVPTGIIFENSDTLDALEAMNFADMRPANLGILPCGRIVAIDYGITQGEDGGYSYEDESEAFLDAADDIPTSIARLAEPYTPRHGARQMDLF